MNSIYSAFGTLLAFFYAIIPSAGVAIILLTVLVRLILFPLTAKQAKSMIAMQRVQPEIKKLQAKYKNDKQKLNEELMRFYKENQINPLGGCLPLLAQMPVFFLLYRTLIGIQDHLPVDSEFFQAACGSAKTAAQCTTPDLSFFGMNLAESASKVQGGFVDALPYYVLILMVVGTSFLQQRQTMKYQTQANPQMQMIGKIMPIFFGFISLNIPAGVVLYFFTSNLWQLGQQQMIYRTIGTPNGQPPGKAKTVDATATERPGGLLARLRPPAAVPAAPEAEAPSPDAPAKDKPASGARPKGAGGSKSGSGKSGGSKQTGARSGAAASKPATGTTGTGGSGSSSSRRRNNRKRKR